MDELLLFFERREELTTEAFGRHYLDVHAPMAVAWVGVIGRYVVNVPEPPAPPSGVEGAPPPSGIPVAPDAVTEVWVDSVAAFQDPRQAFTDREHARTMARDHNSFIGVMHGYRVRRDGPVADPPTVAGAPAVKLVVATWRIDGGAGAGADASVPDGALRIDRSAAPHRLVDRWVVEPITPDPPALVRAQELTCATRADLDALVGAATGPTWEEPAPGVVVTRHVLREHVQRAAR